MKCNCPYSPTVIVPGIGQSKVDLIDAQGNRIKGAWPLDLNAEELMAGLKAPLMKMMLLRHDLGFSEKLGSVIREAVSPLAGDNEGNMINRLRVIDFPNSVAECSEDEKKYIYKMVPMEGLTAAIGEDHLYYFAYNSFGSVYDTAADLRAFIQRVKEKTGHDKVNLIPVSLGGCVSIAYFDAYGDDGDIDRVLNMVAGLNGTRIIGEVATGDLTTDDINGLLEQFIGGKGKDLASILKVMPKGVPEKAINSFLEAILDTMILRSTMMWAMIPCELYDKAREKHLKDKKFDVLRAKADRFHQAQLNLAKIIEKEKAMGVEFFTVCGYGLPLPAFIVSNKMTSDAVINLSSTSLGAYSAPVGETLPESYTQQNTNCCEGHNHISPDRTIDASTGFFPESTWFFKAQYHDDVAYNDVALALSKRILTDKSFTSVHSDARFPQFNGTRNIKKIKYELLPKARAVDRSKLYPGQIAILDEALSKVDEFLDNTFLVDNEGVAEIEKLLCEAVDLVTSDEENSSLEDYELDFSEEDMVFDEEDFIDEAANEE